MNKRFFYIFVIMIAALGATYFFMFDNSYKESLKARFYYTVGEYDKAYSLSRKVYLKNSYNTMALTIMTQSKIALSYEKYIKNAKKYLKEIQEISSSKKISKKDLMKIKLICEVAMGEYKSLKPSVLDNSTLCDEASKLYKKFEKIYNELF